MTLEKLFSNILAAVKEKLHSFFHKNSSTDSVDENAVEAYVLKLADFAREQLELMGPDGYSQFASSDYDVNSRIFCFHRYDGASLRWMDSRSSDTVFKADDVAEEITRIFKLDAFQVIVDDSTDNNDNKLLAGLPTDFQFVSIIFSNNNYNLNVINLYMESKGYRMIRFYSQHYKDTAITFCVAVYIPADIYKLLGISK